MDSILRLVELGHECEPAPPGSRDVPLILEPLFSSKNGFVAFESSLRVFAPFRQTVNVPSLGEWNDSSGWISSYREIVGEMIFFAEDVYGFQFGIDARGVYLLDPEIGSLEFFAPHLDGWAEKILSDFEEYTGYGPAHRWQLANGRLPIECRLAPKIPFVLGGTSRSLGPVSSVELISFRSECLFPQIRDLPDGATVTLEVIGLS